MRLFPWGIASMLGGQPNSANGQPQFCGNLLLRAKSWIKSVLKIVFIYLDMVEAQAIPKTPMSMEDWEQRLSGFLKLWDRDILKNAGKVEIEVAKTHAENEFEKYHIIQGACLNLILINSLKALNSRLPRKRKGFFLLVYDWIHWIISTCLGNALSL